MTVERIVLTLRRRACRCRLAIVARTANGLRIGGSVSAAATGADGRMARHRSFFDLPLSAEACPIDLSCSHGSAVIVAVPAFGAVPLAHVSDAARRAGGELLVD